jgi:hypothetical protein
MVRSHDCADLRLYGSILAAGQLRPKAGYGSRLQREHALERSLEIVVEAGDRLKVRRGDRLWREGG